MEHNQSVAAGTPGRTLAWMAGPFAAVLGLAAHAAGGGQSPAVPIVVALAALLSLGAVLLDRFTPVPLPGWAILVASAVAQQLLHLAFAAFSTASPVPWPAHDHGALPAPGVPAPNIENAVTPVQHSLHLMLYLHSSAALLAAGVAGQWARIRRWAGAMLPSRSRTSAPVR